jgi:hypothetical protein
VLLLLASSLKAIYQPTQFLQSYLFAYLFWLELSLGSMALLMVHQLTGGAWGIVVNRILESSMKTIFLMAFFFIPILCGFKDIFPWANKIQLVGSPHKSIYFEFSFFISRAVFYLIAWMFLAYFLSKARASRSKLCAFGLCFFGLSVTMAAIDWQMSLELEWFSTMYGFIFIIGQALGAWAFTLLILRLLLPMRPEISLPRQIEWDLGNLLLTLVILWAYVSFMQYLIIWSGNLPDEVTWFVRRINHGWEWFIVAIFCFLFVAPFLVLLFRRLKTNDKTMIWILALILVFRIFERFWMIKPSFNENVVFYYTDITLLFGIGGVWLSFFFWTLSKRPIFSINDPNWPIAQNSEVIIHA